MANGPTIHDVAAEAGVSIKTVSRVLNHSDAVRASTASRVREVVERLGYQPNAMAQALARRASDVIGVVVGEPDDGRLNNPFVFSVLSGISQEALSHDYQVMLVTSNQAGFLASLLHTKRLAGLVFVSVSMDDSNVRSLQQQGLPFVLTCQYDPDVPVSLVDYDSRLGSHLAVEHLASLGHKRIALLSGHLNHGNVRDRYLGYCEALEEHNLVLDPELVKPGNFREKTGAASTVELLGLPEPPTAIYCLSDILATGALYALHRQKISVPNMISVVGFDNTASSAYLWPPLTTIAQDGPLKGKRATRLLLELINGRQAPLHEVLTPHLVIRESTGPPSKCRFEGGGLQCLPEA